MGTWQLCVVGSVWDLVYLGHVQQFAKTVQMILVQLLCIHVPSIESLVRYMYTAGWAEQQSVCVETESLPPPLSIVLSLVVLPLNSSLMRAVLARV